MLAGLQAGDRTVVLEEADSVSWLRMKVVTRVTDTRPFFRIWRKKGFFYFRGQRAKQPCLHGYLATAARIKDHVDCSRVDLRKKYERKTWRRPEKNVKEVTVGYRTVTKGEW